MEYIRRDRATGEELTLTEQQVRHKLEGYYDNLDEVLSSITKDNPATTGYADYWKKI